MWYKIIVHVSISVRERLTTVDDYNPKTSDWKFYHQQLKVLHIQMIPHIQMIIETSFLALCEKWDGKHTRTPKIWTVWIWHKKREKEKQTQGQDDLAHPKRDTRRAIGHVSPPCLSLFWIKIKTRINLIDCVLLKKNDRQLLFSVCH